MNSVAAIQVLDPIHPAPSKKFHDSTPTAQGGLEGEPRLKPRLRSTDFLPRDATLLSRLRGGLSLKFLGQGSQRHRDRIVLIDDFRREPAALFCFFAEVRRRFFHVSPGGHTAPGHVIDVPDVTLDPNYFVGRRLGSTPPDALSSTAELIVLDTLGKLLRARPRAVRWSRPQFSNCDRH
jgi:hypothetical protein